MKYSFKPGDIVKLKETENQIGNLDLSFQSADRKEKDKVRYRKWRGEVIRICEESPDRFGIPCVLVKRLDTKGQGKETWAQDFLEVVKEVTDVFGDSHRRNG